MKKIICGSYFFIGIMIAISGCSDQKPFVNHSLQAVKVGDCSKKTGHTSMESNTNGERYIFDYCLPDGFDTKTCTVERKGDTVVVHFPTSEGKTALYNLTLDIDANPRYSFIQLGDQVVPIGAAN